MAKLKHGLHLKTFIDINERQYYVSTVELLYVYETMVFTASNHKIDNYAEFEEYTRHYPDQYQAIVGHYSTIDKLIENLRQEEE